MQLRIEKGPEGDWWATSPESPGFFACGDTREEVIANAKDALSIFLSLDEDKIELEITDESRGMDTN